MLIIIIYLQTAKPEIIALWVYLSWSSSKQVVCPCLQEDAKKCDRLPPACVKLKESFKAHLERLGVKYREGKGKKKPPNPQAPPPSPLKRSTRDTGGVGRVIDLNDSFDLNMAPSE